VAATLSSSVAAARGDIMAIKLPIGRAEVSPDGSGHAVWVEPSAKPIILASLGVTGSLPQIRSSQAQRSLRSPPRMVEAVGIDGGFDTLGKSDAFSVRFKTSSVPASEKGDGATRLPHVWKPRSVSTFERTDPLAGVEVNHVMD
jgi:hypothetical protein